MCLDNVLHGPLAPTAAAVVAPQLEQHLNGGERGVGGIQQQHNFHSPPQGDSLTHSPFILLVPFSKTTGQS